METNNIKEIKELPEVVYPKGTGIVDLSAKLVKREGRICMYERSDMVWEVFKVKIHKPTTLKGKKYPAHEMYPGNEDFGYSAWCFSKLVNADEMYNHMIKFEPQVSSKTGGRSLAGEGQVEVLKAS